MMNLFHLVIFTTIAIRSCHGFQVIIPVALGQKRLMSSKYSNFEEKIDAQHPQQPIGNSRISHAAGSSQTRSRFLLKKRTLLFVGSALSWFLLLGTKVSWASDAVLAATTTATTAAAAGTFVVAKSIDPQISVACELQLIARLIFAAISGSIVGWERSSSKHSAGVRTMALVSLGAAAFTICSAYGFAGKCDPSRMAANVASGVGFLGAGVITTQARASKTESYNIVHGLTTAAAIWLSAALGVASAVGLYLTSFATTLTTVAILRLGKVPGKAEDERVIDHIMSSKATKSKKKNVATYHLSDTHDTSGWDEVQEALTPPGPLGSGLATSFRKPKDMMPNDWLSARFENETISIPDPVDFIDFQPQNFTNATYSAQELEYNS